MSADADNDETRDWLEGEPMDPAAELPEPLPPLPGIPFCHRGAGVILPGPTGGGRSSLVEACAYDAGKHGLRVAYLGSEIPYGEFQARAAMLADLRGDQVTNELRQQLANVRYLDLATVMTRAWTNPKLWVAAATHAFDVVITDPLSAVASAIGLDFTKDNSQYATFYDRIVQPYITAGGTLIAPENLGHSIEAQERAKGASAKQDRADLVFSCKRHKDPEGLLLTAQKVRSIRAPFHRGDKWLFDRDTQTINRYASEDTQNPNWRPSTLMERISRVLEQNPGLGVTAIREAIPSKARNVDNALHYLIDDGHVHPQQDGKTRRHHITNPYRCPDVPTLSHDVPDTMSPCPTPYKGDRDGQRQEHTNDVPTAERQETLR